MTSQTGFDFCLCHIYCPVEIFSQKFEATRYVISRQTGKETISIKINVDNAVHGGADVNCKRKEVRAAPYSMQYENVSFLFGRGR